MPKILQFIRKAQFRRCRLCDEPVDLKSAKTDERGTAFHEECYVLLMRLKESTPPPKFS
jgi:hypothetical protein